MMRELVDRLKEQGISERAACKSVGISRSTYQYESQRSVSEQEQLRAQIVELSRQHKRYGYRRITAILRRQVCSAAKTGTTTAVRNEPT